MTIPVYQISSTMDSTTPTSQYNMKIWLRGKGGVPWVQIMENEFEYLADRGGHGGHLGEKFVKKYCS